MSHTRPETILVAYGTKHGSTRELAEAIARTLTEQQLEVETVAVFAMGPRTVEELDAASSRAQLVKALARVPEVDPFAIGVFGGVVNPRVLRFPFNRFPASDARDWDAIRAWADQVAAAFDYGKAASQARDHRSQLQQTPR